MRRANGTGTVYKLSGKRRKPWIVRVFNHWEVDEKNGKAKAVYTTIGYTATKKEGTDLLAKYMFNPYDLSAARLTFEDVYKEFMIDKFGSVDSETGKAYRTAFNNCPTSLYSVKFIDLRHKSLQKIIDDSDKNYPTLKKIITLFHQMYKYAMKTDYVLKDYSAQVTASKYKDRNPNALDRKIFSNEEIQTLWKHSNNKYIQMILILIYTGLRITTLLELKKSEVHIDERWFHIAKDKTEASIRDVPIAEAILPFFKSWYIYNDSEFMFTTTDNKPLFYRNYRDSYFDNLLAELGMEHKPHDTRHTCSTLLKQAGVPLIERKNILGHEIKDITEDVYTHVPINDLIPCVDKIHDVVMEKELA